MLSLRQSTRFIIYDIFSRKTLFNTIVMILTIAITSSIYFLANGTGNGIIYYLYQNQPSEIGTIKVLPKNRELLFSEKELEELNEKFPNSQLSLYFQNNITVLCHNSESELVAVCAFKKSSPYLDNLVIIQGKNFDPCRSQYAGVLLASAFLQNEKFYPRTHFPKYYEEKFPHNLTQEDIPKNICINLKGEGRYGYADSAGISIPVLGVFLSPEEQYCEYMMIFPEDFFGYIQNQNWRWYYAYQILGVNNKRPLVDEPWVITEISFQSTHDIHQLNRVDDTVKRLREMSFHEVLVEDKKITITTGNIIITPSCAFMIKNYESALQVIQQEEQKQEGTIFRWENPQNDTLLLHGTNLSRALLEELLEDKKTTDPRKKIAPIFTILNAEHRDKFNGDPLSLRLVLKKPSYSFPKIPDRISPKYNSILLVLNQLEDVLPSYHKLGIWGYGRYLDPQIQRAIELLIRMQEYVGYGMRWISMVLIIFLVLIIGSGSLNHSERKVAETGILKTFGLSSVETTILYSLEFIVLVLLGMFIGIFIYYSASSYLTNLIETIFGVVGFKFMMYQSDWYWVFGVSISVTGVSSYFSAWTNTKITIPDALNYNV